MPKPSAANAEFTRHLLRWTKILDLWRVCDRAACRQGRACRGNPDKCWSPNFARLPEELQALYCCILHYKEQGLTFDEMMYGFDESPISAALANWTSDAPDIGDPSASPGPAGFSQRRGEIRKLQIRQLQEATAKQPGRCSAASGLPVSHRR